MHQRPPERRSSPLEAFVAEHDLFNALDSATLADVAAELEVVQLLAGATLFQQGEPGDAMYLIRSGTLRVSARGPAGEDLVLDVLDPGASVGEMALLTGQPRTATVSAIVDSELVKFSRPAFDRLAAQRPEVMTAWARTIIPRWQRAQLADVLTNLFGKLDGVALHDLQAALQWRHLASGEVLFNQGEPGDAMYIVVNGRLRFVAQTPDGVERVVDEVGRGESVGEFALLTGEPRTATVYATRDTDVVKLDQATFESLQARYPHVMRQIAKSIVQRTQRTIAAANTTHRRAATFALVPIRPAVPLTPFAERLTAALATCGATLHLNSAQIDRRLGRSGVGQTALGDPTDVALVGWLTEQELNHQHLVYEADASWSPWTERCLRQADTILLVGQADDDPAPGEIEAAMQRVNGRARTELVLLQPEARQRPIGTARWLDARQVTTHHHVRLQHDGDIQRLARRVSGRATGLVLSGGGARGFAHVGALKAFAERSVLIDTVGGTSIGALIGTVFAMGYDDAQIYRLAQTFASPKQLFDRTLPFAALMRSAKVTRLYRTLFDDVQIEDLWVPFFCVSSNLTRAEPVVHRRGALWAAVRASTAIPGIFTPMLHEGDVLVDGAVMNHFPIDLMREQIGGGTVLAVNASPRTEKLRNYQFGPSISGWQVLWSKLNPFVPSMRVPSIFHLLTRSTEINSVYRLPAIVGLADVLIAPAVERFRTLDFAAYDAIINVGYEAARQQIETWQHQATAPASAPAINADNSALQTSVVAP